VDEVNEIDWDRVDMYDIEREALASTPKSSQRTDEASATLGRSEDEQGTFNARLRGAVDESMKRKREGDETGFLPKRMALSDAQASTGGLSDPLR
jgi:hypothetical protein